MSGRMHRTLSAAERERRFFRRGLRRLRRAVRSVFACELCGALWPVGDRTERCAPACPGRIAREIHGLIEAELLGGSAEPGPEPVGVLRYADLVERFHTLRPKA